MDDVMTLEEAAEYLKISRRTATRLAKAGRIKCAKKVGKQWRFSRAALQQWLGVPARGEKAVA